MYLNDCSPAGRAVKGLDVGLVGGDDSGGGLWGLKSTHHSQLSLSLYLMFVDGDVNS